MDFVFYIIIFLFGLSLGSFLNAFEWRVKHKISLFDARSKCPKCNTQLQWYENIPVLSFVFLWGTCKHCRQRISFQYPAVELWMGLLCVLLAYHQFEFIIDNKSINTYSLILLILNFIIGWILTFIFIYDLNYQEVLDSMTLIPAILIFAVKFFVFGVSWSDMVIGAMIGAGFFLLQYVVSKGRWVGGGDIRIGLLMGVILGWKLTLLALWIAYIVGAIISIGLVMKKKKKMGSQIAFGTFLTVATLVVMVWGERVLGWYVGLIS